MRIFGTLIFHPGLGSENMTGVSTGGNEVSRISIGLLEDMGYDVDYSQADTYVIILPDTEPPMINLNGLDELTIYIGSTYTELATATDNFDISVTVITTIVGPNNATTLDTSIVGTYTFTYRATDTAGNIATPVTRTVIVTYYTFENDTSSLRTAVDYWLLNESAALNYFGEINSWNTVNIEDMSNLLNAERIGSYDANENFTNNTGITWNDTEAKEIYDAMSLFNGNIDKIYK